MAALIGAAAGTMVAPNDDESALLICLGLRIVRWEVEVCNWRTFKVPLSLSERALIRRFRDGALNKS